MEPGWASTANGTNLALADTPLWLSHQGMVVQRIGVFLGASERLGRSLEASKHALMGVMLRARWGSQYPVAAGERGTSGILPLPVISSRLAMPLAPTAGASREDPGMGRSLVSSTLFFRGRVCADQAAGITLHQG